MCLRAQVRGTSARREGVRAWSAQSHRGNSVAVCPAAVRSKGGCGTSRSVGGRWWRGRQRTGFASLLVRRGAERKLVQGKTSQAPLGKSE